MLVFENNYKMKRSIQLFLFLSICSFLIASCQKRNATAEVEHLCTGEYVVIRDNRFKVVNFQLIESYNDGATIRINYSLGKPSEPFEESHAYCDKGENFKDFLTINKIK